MCAACGIPTHIIAEPLTAHAPRVAPTRFAALQSADCRTYLFGTMLSMMADNVEHVISYWVLWQKFHSPGLAGFAVISHWVPNLLFSVYFGGWADRYDCRKIIQLAQAMYMAVSVVWGYLFLTDSLEIWHAAVLLVIHGMAGAIWGPAEQLMLHDIVGREQLPSAVRLNATARSLGMLCGPAVGALLLNGFGETWGIWANVLIYLPLTLWLVTVPYTGHLRDAVQRPKVTLLDALRVLREVADNPTLISMVALGGLSSFFIGTALAPLMPEFARALGTESAGAAYGALLAAGAAGGVLGGVLLEASGLLKPNARTAMIATVVYGITTLGFAFSNSYYLSLLMLLIGGMANLASQSIAQALVQILAPAEKRGRVIGVYQMSSGGLRAGSGFTVGVLGGYIGIHSSLGISSLALAVVSLLLMWYVARAAAARLAPAQGPVHQTS
ncbi:MAG: MFS transporter [Chloroflexota bacterium]